MNELFFYYTCSPTELNKPLNSRHRGKDYTSEIDLNLNDHQVLLPNKSNEREAQLSRIDFIANHPEEMNVIAHLLRKINKDSGVGYYELECISIYNAIVNGEYGEYPIEFFLRNDNSDIQEKIIYYLFQKRNHNNRLDYFKSAVSDVFNQAVIYYYDSVKQKLYVMLRAEETQTNVEIYEICRYFFADLLVEIEAVWRFYPYILDKTDCMIASYGDQLCGNIL